MTQTTGRRGRVGPAPDDLIADALAVLDLEQKVRLLTGASFWRTPAEPAIGLRELVLSDGPAGVRGERYDERDPSLCLPCATALAATWDEPLVRAAGGLLAAEARRKRVDVVLAPTVNLQRSPYAGRHFECYSEDPLLSGRIGAAFVAGLQAGGVAAAVKHYAANDSETDRFTVDVRLDERALREVALAPFEHIVTTARPWLLMAAYNSILGTTMTEHPLLDSPLRDEWGFDGVVVSDWFATRSTGDSARAGLDIVMPGPHGPWGDALIAEVRSGRVATAVIDRKVANLLRLAWRVGAWQATGPVASPAPADAASVLRRGAAAAAVLLTNPDGLLPLDPATLTSVAVLGPNAATARIQGGGSAAVAPVAAVSPLTGLRDALSPAVTVRHADGVRIPGRPPAITEAAAVHPDTGEPGLRVRFTDTEGRLVHEETRFDGRLLWFGEPVVASATAVEAATMLCVETSGVHEVGVAGVGRFTLHVGDRKVFDGEIPAVDGPGSGILNPPQRQFPVHVDAGDRVLVRLRHEFAPNALFMGFALGLRPPTPDPETDLADAVALAAAADIAVVVVGTNAETESEGVDRTTLALPARQDELVRRVAAVNRRTVVVVNAGAPVLLPWRDEVAAVLVQWFPGERGGTALADVLLGLAEPGGRLPMTWPAAETDGPVLTTTPTDGALRYHEGIHCGHRGWARADTEPAFPFGHGLGYTTWELADPVVPGGVPAGEPVVVRVRVRNTGSRTGRQVVQAYLSREGSAVERPRCWLAGYTGVTAAPGETAVAEIRLEPRAFAHWAGEWTIEPGTYQLRLAFSSAGPGVTAAVRVHAQGGT